MLVSIRNYPSFSSEMRVLSFFVSQNGSGNEDTWYDFPLQWCPKAQRVVVAIAGTSFSRDSITTFVSRVGLPVLHALGIFGPRASEVQEKLRSGCAWNESVQEIGLPYKQGYCAPPGFLIPNPGNQ